MDTYLHELQTFKATVVIRYKFFRHYFWPKKAKAGNIYKGSAMYAYLAT